MPSAPRPLLARTRDGLDRLVQELGQRFTASEESLTQSLAKTRAQSDAIAALVRDGERQGAAGGAHRGDELSALREHDAWSRTMKHHLKESAQYERSRHRLLLEVCAYAFTSVARRGDRAEGYGFVLKALARLTADFAQSLVMLSLAATLREWCCPDRAAAEGRVRRRRRAAGRSARALCGADGAHSRTAGERMSAT